MDPAAVVAVARSGAKVEVGEEARGRVRAARRHVERISSGERAVYGVNTGFGALANTRIAPEAGREVQRSLLLSHAPGEAVAEGDVGAALAVLCALVEDLQRERTPQEAWGRR